jgi:GlpG protein
MRLIGHVADQRSAQIFGDYLYVQGIENQIEHDQSGGWGIWVSDEDRVAQATDLFSVFRQNPADPKYAAEAPAAERLRKAHDESEEAYRKRTIERRHLFRPLLAYGFGPFTLILILFSLVVGVLSRLGENPEAIARLFISYSADPRLLEIRSGEVWRLVTPIFIHFGPIHLVFNMLWLRDLGSMIEARQSTFQLVILVLAIAIISNLAQFYVGHSPGFGGMSGVVYGLLGYIWMRGRFDPASGLFLHPYTVASMLVWFFLCFTGALGDIANGAHAAGLFLGMGWGYVSSLSYR